MMNSRIIFILLSMLIVVEISGAQPVQPGISAKPGKSRNWFPYFNFNAAAFKTVPREFGPFTRWWWPGNDVTDAELQREVKMFAGNGFAGVEIQPLTMGINPNATPDQLDRIYSWDTPSFYKHVIAVMEQAKKSGITVDLNGGSGWPLGGPDVASQESMLTLTYADTIITGGQTINIDLPKQLPDYSKIIIFDTLHLYSYIDPSLAKLQAVITARILNQIEGQIFLDAESVLDITTHVTNNRLNFKMAQGGKWVIIAFWAKPDGQMPTLIASRNPGLVANHFDSNQIIKSYRHLFGKRTGLDHYYGFPLRAIFNDSYEFRTDRHYSNSFISFFLQKRGYSIIPWLAANLEKGYNNNASAFLFPNAKSNFVFSDEDWRLRYDYDLTVGELLQLHFIKSSNNWMQRRGMIHRNQAYGIKTDIIASSGTAAIPEAEQLYAKGAEGFVKLVTSGAHLYNRPVVTQESFVFFGGSAMITPQKIKALSDKSFTNGINQIIYSGTSYKYKTNDYGREGWNTWSSPYSGFDFSSNINESFPYWKHIKEINLYIARSQYALRSGNPHTDVLIYFPFADFTQEDLVENPEEILASGYFKGIDPGGIAGNEAKIILTNKQKWFTAVWKTINILNAAGITWDWVNDASVQAAIAKKEEIDIRGNRYQALLLINAPYIQLGSAKRISDLSQNGVKILIIGEPPFKQPGFLNYVENDHKTRLFIMQSLRQKNCAHITDANIPDGWIKKIKQRIKFKNNYRFTRTVEREMKDCSMLRFTWNQSGQWQSIFLTCDVAYKNNYWLDPANGYVIKAVSNSVSNEDYSYLLPPYGSILFYASKTKLADKLLNKVIPASNKEKEIMRIEKWDIKAGTAEGRNSALFEWRSNEAFKYLSSEGIYTASFDLDIKKGKKYFIDAGLVYFTAEVRINGQFAGERIWEPFRMDITRLLIPGKNNIEIRIIPTQRNEFIREAIDGNKKYAHFKGKENTLMPAGLVGPVRIFAF
ncbi:MAG: glycosyl hydrolase [Ferruginibacter sp.]